MINGKLPLNGHPGYTFHWVKRDDAGEVYGWVEDRNGAIVAGCSGWYRDTGPGYARDRASYVLGEVLDKDNTPNARPK